MIRTLYIRHLLVVSGLVSLLFSSCKKDELIANTDPTTKIFLSSIDRTGGDRLNAVVKMSWSGEDKDGYIVGYEISFDNNVWQFTDKQDSTFRFSIENGSDTANIDFFVRAIDNDGNKDKTPAYLRIPIKNTAPTISMDDNMIKGDSVYSVFSLLWNASDLDGAETLDSVYIRINTGNWFAVSKNFNFVSIVPEQPEINGPTLAKVLLGNGSINSNKTIDGLIVGAQNIVYMKVRDLSGAESEVDSLDQFVLRRKTSDLLVLDAFNISSTPNADDVYRAALSSAYGAYDYYDFYRQSNAYFPAVWRPTFSLFLGLYDKVFWYSDNLSSSNNTMLLESGASAIQDYLNNGGKLLIASDFSNNAAPTSFSKGSAIFQYSPADSFQTFYAANQKMTLPLDSLVVPDAANGIGYPVLKVSSFADAVDPFFEKSSALVVYRGQIRKANGVIRTRTLCAKTLNINSKTNQIFFSMDLYKLQGDGDGNGQNDELKRFFEHVFLNEFNW